MTVPQTDSGGRGEYPKARERTLVKELGKIDTVTSGEGVPSCGEGLTRPERRGVAEKRGLRLFTKNTGLCEVVRRRIGSDACPVLEG